MLLLLIFSANWRTSIYELSYKIYRHGKIRFAGNRFLHRRECQGQNIAIRFVSELREKCKILEQFPESGSLPKDRVLKSAGYRFLVHKEYLIFYLYDAGENIAHIVSIFHTKRDYMKVMKKFI